MVYAIKYGRVNRKNVINTQGNKPLYPSNKYAYNYLLDFILGKNQNRMCCSYLVYVL